MSITYEAQDATERFSDSDMEQYGNFDTYAVLSGLAITYDGSNLTFDVAAGYVLHNGNVVKVVAQANAGTFVPDGSNPRWAWISIDSGGSVVLTHGTAAGTPDKPEVGDRVPIAAVKVVNGDTVANNIAVKLNKELLSRQMFTEGAAIAAASTVAVSGSMFRHITGTTGINCLAGDR